MSYFDAYDAAMEIYETRYCAGSDVAEFFGDACNAAECHATASVAHRAAVDALNQFVDSLGF